MRPASPITLIKFINGIQISITFMYQSDAKKFENIAPIKVKNPWGQRKLR